MSVGTALARGRRAAEALMTDTCLITRAGVGEETTDEDTGQLVGPLREPVYEGRCRVQIRGMGSSTGTDVAGAEWVISQAVLQLPVADSAAVRMGDLFEWTACPGNQALVGRKLAIGRPVADKTHATKREFLVTEAGMVT